MQLSCLSHDTREWYAKLCDNGGYVERGDAEQRTFLSAMCKYET